MGKEVVTVEIDAALMGRMRAMGIEPVEYLERVLRREEVLRETPEQRDARAKAWRKENRDEIEWHRKYIEENGLWCEDISPF